MECLIEVVEGSDHRLVRLAGRLTAAQVPDLMGVCDDAAVLRIDLGNLISVDAIGLEALQRYRERGATMMEVPGYIRLKLDTLSASRTLRRS